MDSVAAARLLFSPGAVLPWRLCSRQFSPAGGGHSPNDARCTTLRGDTSRRVHPGTALPRPVTGSPQEDSPPAVGMTFAIPRRASDALGMRVSAWTTRTRSDYSRHRGAERQHAHCGGSPPSLAYNPFWQAGVRDLFHGGRRAHLQSHTCHATFPPPATRGPWTIRQDRRVEHDAGARLQHHTTFTPHALLHAHSEACRAAFTFCTPLRLPRATTRTTRPPTTPQPAFACGTSCCSYRRADWKDRTRHPTFFSAPVAFINHVLAHSSCHWLLLGLGGRSSIATLLLTLPPHSNLPAAGHHCHTGIPLGGIACGQLCLPPTVAYHAPATCARPRCLPVLLVHATLCLGW